MGLTNSIYLHDGVACIDSWTGGPHDPIRPWPIPGAAGVVRTSIGTLAVSEDGRRVYYQLPDCSPDWGSPREAAFAGSSQDCPRGVIDQREAEILAAMAALRGEPPE